MKLSISFEFFPPKSQEAMNDLTTNAILLNDYAHDFFSVTYGAGGSTRQGTLNTVKMLQENTDTPVAPHLSCIGSTTEDITELLHTYQSMNIKRLVAIRGDLPQGMTHAGDIRHASDLIKLIREKTGNQFYIEAAAYPECHPQADNSEIDFYNFCKKVEAGANSAITQYFFNADAYFYFVEKCMQHNINIPINPGIMPITNFTRLKRFSDMCGAEIPQWIRKQLHAYEDDSDSIKAFGLDIISDLCDRLIRGGAPGLHFYTLNHVDVTLELLQRLNIEKKMKVKV